MKYSILALILFCSSCWADKVYIHYGRLTESLWIQYSDGMMYKLNNNNKIYLHEGTRFNLVRVKEVYNDQGQRVNKEPVTYHYVAEKNLRVRFK